MKDIDNDEVGPREVGAYRSNDDVKTEASAVELKLRKSVVHFGG